MLSLALGNYFAMDLSLDLWPGTLYLGDFHAEWVPPFFNELCWSADWSLSFLELWADLSLSLWECDAGLFDWVLNKNSHNCGLNTYKFNNHIYYINMHLSKTSVFRNKFSGFQLDLFDVFLYFNGVLPCN